MSLPVPAGMPPCAVRPFLFASAATTGIRSWPPPLR
jgi:hypothetical protein